MNKNNNFNSTIKQLYINGIENEYINIERELSKQVQPSVDKIQSWVSDSNKIEVEDLITYISCLNAEKYFELGFRKAMNIMLDTLSGGESPQ